MSYRNQTKSSENKKGGTEDSPLDKRRKVATAGKMVCSTSGARATRQGASAIHGTGADQPRDTNSELENMTFTREEVELLLNEKIKTKNKFDYRGKCEHMTEYIKKLKACIKWFQDVEERLLLEQGTLKSTLESSENGCREMGDQIRKKEDEIHDMVAEFNRKYDSLNEEFSKESREKKAIMDSLREETEARAASARIQVSLSEQIEKLHQEAANTSHRMKSLEDDRKRLQEYNTSLQQYNSSLQEDVAVATETIAKLQKEKSAIMENLSNLRGHNALLQEQLRASQRERDVGE